jgi:esterase/lipase superfamily enzyme
MHKERHAWHSPNIGSDMPVAIYGHYGAPILFFPTAAADCEEYERFGLIDHIARFIDEGRVKVYSIESINKRSWLNKQIHPAERARLQVAYDRYVAEEVGPFIAWHCRTPDIGIATTGASFGALHAANTLFKHPDKFRTLIAMSGTYDLRGYCADYYDENIYFNNPVDYMANLSDPWYLDRIRGARILLLTGQGAWEEPEETHKLARILQAKGIPHHLDLWGHDVPHDWPTWKAMLEVYIPKLF